jgi:endonuclease/exonuclease/phosphatase family metal-dependent hydrolase
VIKSIALLLLCGCAPFTYAAPDGPRYAGRNAADDEDDPDVLVVSFNVEYGRHVDEAIAALQSEPDLRGADIILMQEMDADGVRRVAEALHRDFVYYPGSSGDGHDFGNAILSRWPIIADRKYRLPGVGTIAERGRIAVGAILETPDGPIGAFSVHNATAIAGQRNRLAQVDVVALAAARLELPCIVGGDFNTLERESMRDTVERFFPLGLRWATPGVGPTADLFFGSFQLDHLFVRHFEVLDAGTVRTTASDHRALWARLRRR